MVWSIKRGIHQDTLYNEIKEPVACIKARKGGYSITGVHRQPLYIVEEETALSLKIKGEDEGSAAIVLSEHEDCTGPKHKEKLILTWGNVEITIHRTENHGFLILRKDEIIGEIGNLEASVSFQLEDALPFELAALLYALILTMDQEENGAKSVSHG